MPEIEDEIINKFKRRAKYYLDEPPKKQDILEWLSLIQHHGGPTRLLDLTYSYYVALFFSLDQADKESAVFCLHKDLILAKGMETAKKRKLIGDYTYGTREYCNFILGKQTYSPLVMLMEPYNMHERLSRQQGLFAIPFEGRQSFEYNLSLTINGIKKDLPKSKKVESYEELINLLSHDCILLKVKIPRSFHQEIRRDLKLMNISSETLFPGIDGFTKSLYGQFYR